MEEDEEDASKADKDKEQVIKMIFLVIMMRIFSPFYFTPHPRFQNRGSLKLRQDIAMSPEQNLVILIITKKTTIIMTTIMITMMFTMIINDDANYNALPDVSTGPWPDSRGKL